MTNKALLERLRKQKSSSENKVERKRLVVYHDDEELRMIFPEYSGTYANTKEDIERDGYSMASFADIIDIFHAGWFTRGEKLSKSIIESIIQFFVQGSDMMLYVPKEGIYIDRNPKIISGEIKMDKEDILARLKAQDESVGFAESARYDGRAIYESELIKELVKTEERLDRLAEILKSFHNVNFKYSFPYEGIGLNQPLIGAISLDSRTTPSQFFLTINSPNACASSNLFFAVDKSKK
jgi:hypothetical protein